MYKDKDKQREAKQKAFAEGVTSEGVTDKALPTIKDLADEFVRNSPERKRGKDIKSFRDLPMDVQLSIDLMDIGPEEKKRRTAIAVNYQHQFPTGVA